MSDAVSGGSQTFFGSSSLNASVPNSISGGTQTFYQGSTLRIGADNALTATTNIQFDNTQGGVGGTLQLNGYSTTVGTIGSISSGSGAITNNGARDSILTVHAPATTPFAFSGIMQDGSGAGKLGLAIAGGNLTLSGANTYSGGTRLHGGVLSVRAEQNLGNVAGGLTFDGGVLQVTGTGFTGTDRNILINTGGGGFDIADANNTFRLAQNITGTGALLKQGGGTLVLAGTNGYTGGTRIEAGTLQIGNGGTSGSITGNVANNGTLAFNRSDSVTFSGAISGTGALRQEGSGTLALTGENSYEGATTVAAGTLVVNGSIAASSGMTVAPGAVLTGSGALPATTITGTISPGNSPGTMRVGGDLVLGAGALYLAEIQGAASDRIEVTGSAALAGTLRIVPLGGAYNFTTSYTLLSAQGGRSGTFTTVDTTGSFGDGVTTNVSYGSTTVALTLTPKPLAPIIDPVVPTPVPPPGPGTSPGAAPTPAAQPSAIPSPAGQPTIEPSAVEKPASTPATRPGMGSKNAYAVALGIDRAVAQGGDPSGLFNIYNLPAAAIPAALNQLAGEIHTAPPQMAAMAADQFLRIMVDPTLAGRSGSNAGDASMQRPGMPAFTVWGAAYGSRGWTNGSARVGSATRNIDDAHIAVGLDIRPEPGTTLGFAVSGGTSRASLSGNPGNANADAFQAGLYAMSRLGPIDISGAFGFSRLRTDVRRAVPILGSSLSDIYTTSAWSGRLQASTALLNWRGLTVSPLAALQAIHVNRPAVVEPSFAPGGSGALALRQRNDLTARGELSLQLDINTLVGSVPVSGYLRAGWAHYFQRDAALSASLIGLPGSGFSIDGAIAGRNAALLSTGFDIRVNEAVTLGGRIDGEFAGGASRIGGSAQLRVNF